MSVNTSDKAPEKDSIEKQMPKYVTEEKLLSIIREIGKSLVDENIYQKKQVDEVFNLKPNGSFLEAVNALLHKFKRKKDRDIFIKEYYGKMYGSWKEYFHPLSDHKVVFLMLVNLPERLICLIQDPQITSDDTV